MQTIQEQSFALLKEQAANWALFKKNLEGLHSAQLRTLEFDGFRIKLQFNPKRIVSWVEEAYRETAKRMDLVGLRG